MVLLALFLYLGYLFCRIQFDRKQEPSIIRRMSILERVTPFCTNEKISACSFIAFVRLLHLGRPENCSLAKVRARSWASQATSNIATNAVRVWVCAL
jgi:hypothetical protein